jgi:hypothetical protein
MSLYVISGLWATLEGHFGDKNDRFRKKLIWPEPSVIIFQCKSGTLPIDATNRSFYPNCPVIGQDGYSGCLRQRSFMDLEILNYVVTSNHLLVVDGDAEVVPQSLQLVAGKTAQEFNRRKNRKGAGMIDVTQRR